MAQLDLHGYRTDEAEAAIDRFLMSLTKKNLKRARILTGIGTGAIRSLTIKYLKRAGYQWEYERLKNGKINEGCLVIFLD